MRNNFDDFNILQSLKCPQTFGTTLSVRHQNGPKERLFIYAMFLEIDEICWEFTKIALDSINSIKF